MIKPEQKPNYLFSLYKGNISLFLEARAKNPSKYDFLLPQVKQQINNFEKMNQKLVNEKKQALDAEENIALWQSWFAIKLSMQEAANKMELKADQEKKKKEADDAAFQLHNQNVQASILSAKEALKPSAAPKEQINFHPNGYYSDLNSLVEHKVVTKECIDKIYEKINKNDATAVKELEFLKRGDITNNNKHQFEKTGCADETAKNRADFVNYANNDKIPQEERNKMLDKYTTLRRVAFQCTRDKPEGSTISAEQRNLVNYAKRLIINDALLEAAEKRKNKQP